jgi:hypothetical protein
VPASEAVRWRHMGRARGSGPSRSAHLDGAFTREPAALWLLFSRGPQPHPGRPAGHPRPRCAPRRGWHSPTPPAPAAARGGSKGGEGARRWGRGRSGASGRRPHQPSAQHATRALTCYRPGCRRATLSSLGPAWRGPGAARRALQTPAVRRGAHLCIVPHRRLHDLAIGDGVQGGAQLLRVLGYRAWFCGGRRGQDGRGAAGAGGQPDCAGGAGPASPAPWQRP